MYGNHVLMEHLGREHQNKRLAEARAYQATKGNGAFGSLFRRLSARLSDLLARGSGQVHATEWRNGSVKELLKFG